MDNSDGLPARLWTDQTCLRRRPDPATDRSTWRGRGPSRSGWHGAEEERGGPETKWSGWSATECRRSRGSRRSSGKSLSRCLPGIRRSPVEKKHSTCWVMRDCCFKSKPKSLISVGLTKRKLTEENSAFASLVNKLHYSSINKEGKLKLIARGGYL